MFQVDIPSEVIDETITSLRKYGQSGCEGLVLWLGEINNQNFGVVQKALTPPQRSIQNETGVGYFVTSETLFSLNKFLSETGLRLIAQVHSHPGHAYHSEADDRYCIVTSEGGFSLVVPNFALPPTSLTSWAAYKLKNGRWKKVKTRELIKTFYVDGKELKLGSSEGTLISKIKDMF